jgi:phosphatidate cytidylyltransferase
MARTHHRPEPAGPASEPARGHGALAGLVSGWRGGPHAPAAGTVSGGRPDPPADTGPLRRVGTPPVPPMPPVGPPGSAGGTPDTAQLPALGVPRPGPGGPPAADQAPEDGGVAARPADGPDPDDPGPDDPGPDPDGPPLTALPGALGAEASGAAVLDVPGGPPAAPSTGRAGRDMAAAISVGLGLGAVILLALLVWRPAFLLVLTAAVLISVVELSQALTKGGYRPALPPLVVGSVAIVALAWTRGPAGLVVAFLLTVFAVLLWRLADGPVGYLRDAPAPSTSRCWPGSPPCCWSRTTARPACSPSSARSSAATWGALPPGCWPAGTPWRPRSAPRSPGRDWAGRSRPAC